MSDEAEYAPLNTFAYGMSELVDFGVVLISYNQSHVEVMVDDDWLSF